MVTGSDTVTEAFTELADTYEATVDRELRQLWGFSYRQFVERLVSMTPIREGDVVLDVATGTALIPLSASGKLGDAGRIVGLDITPEMLRHAQKNLESDGLSAHIRLVCASGMDMPFPEGTFDVVICGLGTHHMGVPQMLSEIRRVLRRGGNVVLADVGASPFWRSLAGRLWLRVLMVQFGLTHSRSRTRAEIEAFANMWSASQWRRLLQDHDFTDIEITEHQARRSWYPRALIMRAVARTVGSTSTSGWPRSDSILPASQNAEKGDKDDQKYNGRTTEARTEG